MSNSCTTSCICSAGVLLNLQLHGEDLLEAQEQYCRMMGQENKDMDVESLKARRGSCLDVFLVMSVIFLFVAVTAVAVGGALVVTELRSQLKSTSPTLESKASKLMGDSPYKGYMEQNFVYLEAVSSQLRTSTMQWASVPYGAGSSKGSNFLFDEDQSSLKPIQVGTYFIYVEFNLTCTCTCNAGLFSVHVGDKLTCDVHLPAVSNSTPVTKRCWTVSHINNQRLVTQMTVPNDELQYWKLELIGSGLGLFLVG